MKITVILLAMAIIPLGIMIFEEISRQTRDAAFLCRFNPKFFQGLACDTPRVARRASEFACAQTMPDQSDYVVLLHGMGRTTRSMKKIEQQFVSNGFRVINVAYPSTRAPIETLATQYLGQAITTQCCQPDRKIHFVTHSLGGIVLAYYLQNHAPPNLGRVVMLCPPNQGSELVDQWRNNILYRFLTGPAGQQLGTAPSNLPNRLGAVTFELGVIAGNRSLNPWTSHIIPGADDGKVAVTRTKVAGMKDFLIVPRSHTFIMRDREVINQTLFFIKNGLFKKSPS